MFKDQLGKQDHYAIVSFPRNATKTLADSLDREGYHNFGEFLDVSTSGIDLGWDRSFRLNEHKEFSPIPSLNSVGRNLSTTSRYAGYIQLRGKYEKSSVTIWPESFFSSLNILNDMAYRKTCMILITREHKFEQLISYAIAKQFWYWNTGKLSSPVAIDKDIFCTGMLGMNRINQLHEMIKAGSDNYVEIDFYDITHGRIPLFKKHGTQYKRQMGNMYRFVSNLEELKKLYVQYMDKL